ncbi:MAG: NAD+ synthase [Burkholderiaceae bacterium]|jgi:NAD+ synthase (glutamine-hydrolysing)|nr:NAD+ synthase [Burkholderiales bacterium]MCZ8106615.1 NAD+ synthase [Burkholderiales bacterium]MCZ8340170.1 NAD+ synthase [Burkholderiaceae bacterium]
MPIRIASAQLNQVVGDFEGNRDRIASAAQRAHEACAQVLVTPELSLTGYPPEDLLLRGSFYDRTRAVLGALVEQSRQWPSLRLVVGHPSEEAGRRHNAASVVHAGRVLGVYRKRELPNYGVFDEQRYFEPGDAPLVVDVDGVPVGVVICEDFWFPNAPAAAKAAGARVLVAPNASPYHLDKQGERMDTVRRNVCAQGLSIVLASLVGGQDELVFDGMGFALNADGSLAAQAPAFVEDLLLVDVADDGTLTGPIAPAASLEAQVYAALVLGVRDYLGKNGFPGAIIGLSGGVDSALTLAIAVDALGRDKVRAVMMPSRYTADISWIDARDMAARLGVRYDEIPIATCFDAFLSTLAGEFEGTKPDTTEENLQARIRGTILMALSNKFGSIVLTTGNKSEMAVGYSTLYGDLAGGFAVIKDIAKTLVYRLCAYRNEVSEVIPERIITRPPSAELRPDQKDQDSLPPYDQLDGIVQMYMEEDRRVDDIVAAGYPRDAVEKVVRLMRISEYKRRQAPVGIRVTPRAFGRDWRYPITSKFRD